LGAHNYCSCISIVPTVLKTGRPKRLSALEPI
jgi:hypothetical protein